MWADMPIEPDIVVEGKRLLERSRERGLPLRLLGGVAIRLRAGDAYPRSLERDYADLDFVTVRGASKRVDEFLVGEGYEPYTEFNVVNASRRLLFFDDLHQRQVDVFVGAFAMCHTIPVEERLELDRDSIPLAELLLTKLQIVQLNEKDIRDALGLLASSKLGEEDGELLNVRRVAELCASDWGLYRTITSNLEAVRAHAGGYDLDAAQRDAVDRRLNELLTRIGDEPKSRRWRLRARVGERLRWYELPEEVEQGV